MGAHKFDLQSCAAVFTILGTCIAAFALVLAIAQWLNPLGGTATPAGQSQPTLAPAIPVSTTISAPVPTAVPVSQPTAETIDISGLWRDNVGTVYYITQNGNTFDFTGANQSSGLASTGHGTIAQHQIQVVFETNLPSTGRGVLTLSPDQRQMSGNMSDSVLGVYTLIYSR